MKPDLRDWLDIEAARTGMNRSEYVRRLIERERDKQTSERIAALERRIAALEFQQSLRQETEKIIERLTTP